ncbi:contact-dependent growth inhibition system immunity protein [Janibacter hoylei]
MSKSWLAARIRYPALADLMGSGFHQDFWDFHESPGDVVSAFTGDPIFCARIPLEVGELLGEVDGVGARGGKVLVLRTSAGSVRYPGALVQALGRGRVFARGEGADVVAPAVGESILVAYDAGMQLRLATRSLRLVSRREGRLPHWEFDPADRGLGRGRPPVVDDGGAFVDVDLEYPSLAELLSGGFVQEYEDLFGDAEAVISMYTADPVFCARIPDEVHRLLARADGPRLDEALRRLHNGYAYEAHGRSAREFLEMVAARARDRSVVPVAPYADLVGQQVSSVVKVPPVGVVIGCSVVEFVSGMMCSAAGGRDLTDVEQARLAIGQHVLWAGERDGGVSIATARTRIFTPVGRDTPEPSFARRFLRANILEAVQELGEDEYDTRTGFTLGEARRVADLLRPVVPGTGGAS